MKVSRILKALFLHCISQIWYLFYYLELLNYVVIFNFLIKRYLILRTFLKEMVILVTLLTFASKDFWRFLNYVFIDKKIYVLAPKKKLVCILPYIGKKSLQLRSKLVKSVQNNLSFCNLKVVFRSTYKLHTLFLF